MPANQGIESAFAYRRSIREEVGHAIRVHAGHPFDVRIGKQELVAVILQELVVGHVEERTFRAQLVEERHDQSEPVGFHGGILMQSDLVMATFRYGLCHTFQENLVECYCGATGFLNVRPVRERMPNSSSDSNRSLRSIQSSS